MPASTKDIVNLISESNNSYRNTNSPVRHKLLALWDIGDKLLDAGVQKPHQMGWAVQNETRGLIKRSTIVKGCRLRAIWPSKETLIKDLGDVRAIASIMDMIPIIDPAKPIRGKLSKEEISEMYLRASRDTGELFRKYMTGLKRKYSQGQLGKSLDRSKRLGEMDAVVNDLRALILDFHKIINDPDKNVRTVFRNVVSNLDLAAFSNMCIALTTRENIRLYRRSEVAVSNSENEAFRRTYAYFYEILNKKSDEERARLRRRISSEALAQISDMASSLISEKMVLDYRARQKMIIKL